MKKAISAQKTHMYLENPNAPAAASGLLTSVTKSAPASVVFDDVSSLRNGASVHIISTGFASIDGRSWILQGLDSTTKTATLADSDTSGESGNYAPASAWSMRARIDICAASYQRTENAPAEINVTTLCDDENVFLTGFADPGTFTFDFFIDPADPDYQALRDARREGDERMLEIAYRNGAVRTLPVVVQTINESGGVDQAIQGSVTMRITGPDVLTMPAAGVAVAPRTRRGFGGQFKTAAVSQ